MKYNKNKLGTPKKCPKCGRGLKERVGIFGKFLGCSGYPSCKYTFDLRDKQNENKVSCPKCGMIVFKRKRKDGEFLQCKRYPKCSFKIRLKEGTKTKIKCPRCGKKMIIQKGTSGWSLNCGNSPKCMFIYELNIDKIRYPNYKFPQDNEWKHVENISTERILDTLASDSKSEKELLIQLNIIDKLDIRYLKIKLKELERKKMVTKLTIKEEEYWKKG